MAVTAGAAPGGDGAEANHRWLSAAAGGLICGSADEKLTGMLASFNVRSYPDTQAKALPYPDTTARLPQCSNTPAVVLAITG